MSKSNIRIAVMLSGETRNYNTVGDRQHPQYFVNILKEYYDTVDVYGTTWSHCEPPDPTKLALKQFVQIDQSVIDEWVMEDFMYRGWNHDSWNPNNRLDQLGSELFVDTVLTKTRAAYGQHWIGFESFAMPDVNEYDIFIRFRWDLGLDNFPSHDIEQWIIDRNIHSKISWIHNLEQTENMNMLLTTNNSFIHPYCNTSIEDTMFIMNSGAVAELRKHTIQERLLRVFNDFCNGGIKSSAHTLWHQLIWYDEINIGMHIDNIFSLNRDVEKSVTTISAQNK